MQWNLWCFFHAHTSRGVKSREQSQQGSCHGLIVVPLVIGRSPVRFRTWSLIIIRGCPDSVVGYQGSRISFQRVRIEGEIWPMCPVGCGALVVSCPRRVGPVPPAGSCSSPRPGSEVKSEGKKTSNIILK